MKEIDVWLHFDENGEPKEVTFDPVKTYTARWEGLVNRCGGSINVPAKIVIK